MPIIDLYDDPKGSVLKNKLTHDQIPPVIKEGHILTKSEVKEVPNRLFSLIMADNGRHIRKFACPDAANTAMSTFYFLENWKELPAPAVKTAAANLVTASEWYDLPVPNSLKKLAGLGSTVWGAIPVAPHMPSMLSGGFGALTAPSMWKAGKKRSAQHLKSLGIAPQTVSKSLFGARPKYGSAELEPFVDVTGEPPIKEKLASLQKKAKPFTISSPDDVKRAVELYKEKRGEAHPTSKVEFCRELVKCASLMGLAANLPQEVKHYASSKTASPQFMQAGLMVRREMLGPERFEVYIQKISNIKGNDQDEIAEKIASADKDYYLDQYWGPQLPDPWYITRGLEKTAEYRFNEAGKSVTGTQLRNLAKNGKEDIKKYFGQEFMQGFINEPVLIFKSMPLKQKKILISLANKERKR